MPIISLEIVEMYVSDRALRQLGLIQHIRDPVLRLSWMLAQRPFTLVLMMTNL